MPSAAGSDTTQPEQETSASQPFYGSSSYQAPASQPSYSSHQTAASSQALPYNLYPAATQASYSGGYAPQSAYQQPPQAQAPAQQQGFAGYAQQAQQAAQNTQYAMPAAASEPAKPGPAAPLHLNPTRCLKIIRMLMHSSSGSDTREKAVCLLTLLVWNCHWFDCVSVHSRTLTVHFVLLRKVSPNQDLIGVFAPIAQASSYDTSNSYAATTSQQASRITSRSSSRRPSTSRPLPLPLPSPDTTLLTWHPRSSLSHPLLGPTPPTTLDMAMPAVLMAAQPALLPAPLLPCLEQAIR